MRHLTPIVALLLSAARVVAGELDSAPGTGSDTNSASGAKPISVAAPLMAGTELIPNGAYAQAPQDPAWPDTADGGSVKVGSDNAVSYLELMSLRPGQQVQAYRVIDLPAGARGLGLKVNYRLRALQSGRFPENTARVVLEFLDAKKKPMAAARPLTLTAGATDWTWISEDIAVPSGAVQLAILPGLFRVQSGTLDLAEVRLTTLDAAASVLAARAATQSEADRLAQENAVLAQDLAAAPTSKELKAAGNQLVDSNGTPVLLQGVNIGNLSIRPDEEQKILWSAHVALTDWHANVIRLPVLDSFWFGRGHGSSTSNDAEAYRTIADKVIRIAAGKGAYVVFDLHRYLTPDASCITFWQDAAARYRNNPAVLFDILNEPHDTSWDIWRNGGTVPGKGPNPQVIQSVGMQALVEAVRGTGARNVIVAGGLGYAFDLTGVVNGYALEDKSGNGIMYATHFYNWHGGWARHILPVAARYPVLVGECGADVNKMNFIPANKQEDPYTWVPDALGFIQQNHLNWTAWCFHTRATPDLLLDWEYDTPTPFWGAFVKDALNGGHYALQHER